MDIKVSRQSGYLNYVDEYKNHHYIVSHLSLESPKSCTIASVDIRSCFNIVLKNFRLDNSVYCQSKCCHKLNF